MTRRGSEVTNVGRCARRCEAMFRFQRRALSPPRATAGRDPSEAWALEARKHVVVSSEAACAYNSRLSTAVCFTAAEQLTSQGNVFILGDALQRGPNCSGDACMRNKALILILVASTVVLAFVVIVAVDSQRTTVHRIDVPGHPGKTVDFIQARAMTGERGYIVRLPNGSETKEAFVLSDVSVEELRQQSSVEYFDETLIVFGPRGRRMEIGGYVP